MPGDAQLDALLAMMRRDGMVVQTITVPTAAVVYVKAILEAYPGLASVHAARGKAQDERTRLFIASSPEVQDDVADICFRDLAEWGALPVGEGASAVQADRAVEGLRA